MSFQFGIVTLAFLVETEAWWLVGENGNDHQCPRRGTNVEDKSLIVGQE